MSIYSIEYVISIAFLIGYLLIVGFFIYQIILSYFLYYKKKNIFELATSLFIFASFLPLLPSGSFFTTYAATIFWINNAIMITFLDEKKD